MLNAYRTVAGQVVVAAVAAAAVAVGRAVELAMEARSRAAGREDTGLDSSSGQAAERPRTEAGLPGRDRAAGHSRVISSRSKPLGDRFVTSVSDAVFCFDMYSGLVAVLHRCRLLLWSPYLIGHTIIFSCCGLFFFLLLFFPRLISAAADWMSAILPHMVWP